MDSGVCVPVQHRRVGSDGDRGVFEISYKPLDVSDHNQYMLFLGLFYDFHLEVNEDDLSEIIDWPLKNGTTTRTTKCEAMFDHMSDYGGKVQLVYDREDLIGFLLYHSIFDCMIVIRCMYTTSKYYDAGLGKGLINSLPIEVRRVIFQTRRTKPPEQMLKVTDKYRSKVCESDELITWEMPWGVNHGRRTSSRSCRTGS